MSEDLAIDIGLKHGSDEFKNFVVCVDDILDYGFRYSESIRKKIIKQCSDSKLDIARDVIYECQKGRRLKRTQNLKWWQTYRSSYTTPEPYERKKKAPPVRKKNSSSSSSNIRGNKAMKLTFERGHRDSQSYSHTSPRKHSRIDNRRRINRDNHRRNNRRKMNLTFEQKKSDDEYVESDDSVESAEEVESDDSVESAEEEYYSDDYNQYSSSNDNYNRKRKRAMSPLFVSKKCSSDVPEWPVRRSERNKRRENNNYRNKQRRR
jgi:hypothetical protein